MMNTPEDITQESLENKGWTSSSDVTAQLDECGQGHEAAGSQMVLCDQVVVICFLPRSLPRTISGTTPMIKIM